jgi:hypothetical protein
MKRATLILAGLVFTAAYVFAGQTPLISAPLVAPATGTVTYQRQGNQARLSVRVVDLKPASQLKPSPRKVYVVWLQEPNKSWRNLGVLQVSNSKANLTASVPAGNMFVLVTAENNPHGNAPSGPEVMQATLLGQ